MPIKMSYNNRMLMTMSTYNRIRIPPELRIKRNNSINNNINNKISNNINNIRFNRGIDMNIRTISRIKKQGCSACGH